MTQKWLRKLIGREEESRHFVSQLHEPDGTLLWSSEWRDERTIPFTLAAIAGLVLLGDGVRLYRRRRLLARSASEG